MLLPSQWGRKDAVLCRPRYLLVLLLATTGIAAADLSRTLAQDANPPYEQPDTPDVFDGTENLFLKQKVTASGHVFFSLPENATNGKHSANSENADSH